MNASASRKTSTRRLRAGIGGILVFLVAGLGASPRGAGTNPRALYATEDPVAPAPIRAAADGSFTLPARLAEVIGKTLRYEPQPQKNTLGYWTDPNDYARWHVQIEKPGRYEVRVLQGCGRDQGGSVVRVTLGGDALAFAVEDTGHFQNFRERIVGRLSVEKKGEHTLEVRPQHLERNAVVDLREVRLIPVRDEDASPRDESAAASTSGRRPPNVVLIVADDLGFGELGSYGQTKIRTPHLDRLAEEGVRFTQHYSGSPVCASARCVLLTGKHTGHAYVRTNHEMEGFGEGKLEGQLPLPAGTTTIATLLQGRGYRTGAIGKWGLGGPNTCGHPNRQGFDFFYGYLCQREAHNYYPTHLWKNETRDILANHPFSPYHRLEKAPDDPKAYESFRGEVYAPDRMTEEALGFIRRASEHPFFLYLPFTIPHVALQVPGDSLAEYEGRFPEKPYLGEKGYLPHPTPRAAYAAMITRMDREIGKVLALLDELELGDDTIVFVTSDNGPTYAGGADAEFFESAGGLRGLKGELYEGGIRVPLIARWRGKIAPGRTSDHVSGFQDFLPTLAEIAGIAGAEVPEDIDGVSFLPVLLGTGEPKEHEFLYWEYHAGGGSQAVRMGNWKAVRRNIHKDPGAPTELYDLAKDPTESTDVAATEPEVIERVRAALATRTRSPFARWNFD